MIEQVSHYFARGNTARGAHYLYDSAFRGLDKMYVLEGPPGTGKSTVLRNLAENLLDKGQHVQYFHSPLRPDELDGFIATELKVGVIDGQACEGIPKDDAGELRYFYFEEALHGNRMTPETLEEIEMLKTSLKGTYSTAYETFATALRIHDEWEKYYIESMDFAKADQVTREQIEELFDGHEGGTRTVGRHLFFGAATPKGAFDFIQSLTSRLERRIFIKGRPGSGKSTMLKKLAAAAEGKGIEVQIYHCGFDPNSLDMLIFPQLSTAIFDSTAPHEYFPERHGDEILDMYARTMAPGIDETYKVELAAIKERYSAAMKKATAYLASAEVIDSQIKAFYTAATNFAVVEGIHQHLRSELDKLLRVKQ